MRLREAYVRKHICTFVRTHLECDDPYGFGRYDIERKCSDCGKQQSARISRDERVSLPDSVLHLGEFDWKEGPL